MIDVKTLGDDPAYPVIGAPGSPEDFPGLSKRQYFAGLAMQGLLACGDAHDENTSSVTAAASVSLADALLAELAKESA